MPYERHVIAGTASSGGGVKVVETIVGTHGAETSSSFGAFR